MRNSPQISFQKYSLANDQYLSGFLQQQKNLGEVSSGRNSKTYIHKLSTSTCFQFFLTSKSYVSPVILLAKISTKVILTHSFPMDPLSIPWKHQKTLKISDVFRRYRKGALGTNKLNLSENYIIVLLIQDTSLDFTFEVCSKSSE